MPFQFLPKQGSEAGDFGQALGTGLGAIGSGLSALAQHKVQQMQKQKFRSALESMGYSPEIVNAPERLQPSLIKEGARGLQALQAQQNLSNQFAARLAQAQKLNINPEFLQLAQQFGPEIGSKMLEEFIAEGKKPRDEPSAVKQFIWGGKKPSPYIGKSNSALNQLSQKYGLSGNQNVGLNALTGFSEASPIQQYENLLNNPEVSAEDKEALREELMQATEEKTFGEKLAGVPANLLSGLVQGIGTLGGAPRLLESLLSPVAQKIGEYFVPGEIEKYKKEAESFPEGSKERAHYEKVARDLQENLEKSKNYEYVTPSSEDIKEKVVRPIAQASGLERIITNPDYIGKVAERIGNVTPALATSALMSGGALAQKLLSNLTTGTASEAAGELAKEIVGPKADIGISILGYLTGGFRPGKFKKIISDGYQGFQKLINTAPSKKVDAAPLLEVMDEIDKSLITGDKGSKLLKNRIGDINKKITRMSASASQAAKIPEVNISAKDAAKLDQALGGVSFEAAKKAGGNTVEELTKLRNGLRKVYEPYYSGINKKATENLIAARNLKKAFHSKDAVQDFLEGIAGSNKGFFSKMLFALRKGAALGAHARKYTKLVFTSPEFRSAFGDVLVEGAKQNAGGAIKSIEKLNKLVKDRNLDKNF